MSVLGGIVLDKFGVKVCSLWAAVLILGGYGPVVYAILTAHHWRMPALIMGALCLLANQVLLICCLCALTACLDRPPQPWPNIDCQAVVDLC